MSAWEGWLHSPSLIHKYVNILTGPIVGLVSTLQHLLIAGGSELLLVDHYRKEAVLSISHDLNHSSYLPPMSNSLVLLWDCLEEERPELILMAANNDKRVCLFVLKRKGV